jgi:DNA repair protein SbcC/Rad50
VTIKSIHLVNFQSHADTHIDFSPGVNVIIGPSRNGKTSILRALRWVAENRPSGEAFKRHGSEKEGTEVSLELDTGQVITRVKTSNDNYYDLNGEPFRAFGQDVPLPISKVLNLSPINTAGQFDQPYLIFDSPGEVARTLNKIVHLDVIDTSLSNVAGLKRQNDQDIRVQQNRLNELNELKVSFPDLEGAEEFITELENQQKEKEKKEHTILALSSIQNNLITLREEFAKIQIPVGIEQRIDNLIQKQEELEQKSYTLNLLRDRQSALVNLRYKNDQLKLVVNQEEAVSVLITKNAMLGQKKKILSRFWTLNEQIRLARTRLDEKIAIIIQEETKFKELMPIQCPLCGK